ncbi:IS66 family insertion sequence element accessory protein TnpB [bacterium]|nr:IS66 family insertion sequence element accessory protein TnpB [Candidatus Neomarinimicrobiota bacterium]MCK5684315.1 IS66 family insertion sequence element accessory protein TnpB [bacterium]
MIQLVPQMRFLLACKPVDFRKGIDGLSRVCKDVFDQDPFSGCMFFFINKCKTSIKVLVYDGQGYWLCQKRLSVGRIRWWPSDNESGICNYTAAQLQVLLSNGNPNNVNTSPQWRRLV